MRKTRRFCSVWPLNSYTQSHKQGPVSGPCYPTVPAKTGYTGTWPTRSAAIHSDISITAFYTSVPKYTVTFVADGTPVSVLTVNSGYVLKDSDYPTVPYKSGYIGRWNKYTEPIDCNVRITATHVKSGTVIIPTQPTEPPGEIMSEDELEPVEADPVLPEAGEAVSAASVAAAETAALSDRDGQRLVSTQTVQHDYLTLNGKVARETISVDGTVTTVMDFIYDESGRPFALNYSANGGKSFKTYYYILNLQGDVVKLVWYIPGFEYEAVATYTYDAWGNILTATGELAEINPLRYRGYYYDSETGFYYLQSRYYDPATRRFINADGYASTGQGFTGTNMFAYCGNNAVNIADYSGESGEWIELGDGWYCYIHPQNDSTGTKRHIHVFKKGGNHYSQNDDGSPHDRGKNNQGKLPKKVQRALKNKTGWDYNGNRKKFFDNTEIEYTDSMVIFTFADGTVYSTDRNFLPTWSNTASLETYYFNAYDDVSAVVDSNSNAPIYFAPSVSPGLMPSFGFGASFSPIPIMFWG